MTFVAGPYTWTYGDTPAALGIMEDAPQVELTNSVQEIRGDNLGDSVQDGVYRGGNMYVNLVLQEYNAAAALNAFFPWAANWGEVGTIGQLMSASGVTEPLIGTAVAGTTAHSSGGQIHTYHKACLAPNFPLSMLMGTRLRNVPLRLQILPYDDSGTMKWFSITSSP